jgi:hypothetical protein
MASVSIRTLTFICLWVLQIYVRYAAALIPPHFRSFWHDVSFDWSSITPSKGLVYQDCYSYKLQFHEADNYGPRKLDGRYQCARLLVPLDWQNTSNPNEVAIALIKRPAKVLSGGQNGFRSGADARSLSVRYGGAVIVNPGGPGELLRRPRLLHD